VIPYELISIIAIFITAILILVFCEIIPKTIGVKFARKLAIKVAPIIYYLSKAMAPISFTIDWLSKYVIKLVSSLPLDNISAVDPGSKITTLIDIGEDEGSVKRSESKIIDNLLSLQRINLTRILTPEPDLFLLPAETNRDEALIKVRQRGFSRIPIYDGDSDNIIGILYAKDLLTHDSSEIHTILNEPYFVPDKKNVFELLRELQIKKTHMAIVLDEYGRLEGIVTLEDILEEIFGEIEDEKEVDTDSTIFRGGILYISGGLRINDFNSSCLFAALRYGGIENIGEEISNSTIPVDQDIETIGGYIFTQLGRLPNESESIIHGNIRLKVLTLENNRITRLSVERVND
jgi:putative hemolysin